MDVLHPKDCLDSADGSLCHPRPPAEGVVSAAPPGDPCGPVHGVSWSQTAARCGSDGGGPQAAWARWPMPQAWVGQGEEESGPYPGKPAPCPLAPSCAPCWTCPSVIYTLPLTVFSSPEALTPVSPASGRPVSVPRCVFFKIRFCLIRHP